MATTKCPRCGGRLPARPDWATMCARCSDELGREQEGEREAEMAIERWHEGGWDVTGRYAAEEEEDLQRAIASGNACEACGSVVHVADKDGYCYMTRPAQTS